MASMAQSLSLRVYALYPLLPRNPRALSIHCKPSIKFYPLSTQFSKLSIQNSARVIPQVAAASSQYQPSPAESSANSSPVLLSESTRTITALVVFIHTVFRAVAHKISIPIVKPNPQFVGAVQSSLATAGPAFFASLRDRPAGYLNTPLTVVAAGLSKWLDIYSGVLMVRVLLSWFPNIPWERQPLSAIRDLCDPYLNLFRNIIPPVFGALDVSPLLAFAVLGCLGSILNGVV